MFDTTSAPEPAIERALRKLVWLVPALTVAMTILLFALIFACERLFSAGHTWILLVSGLLTHAVRGFCSSRACSPMP
jgi:hypothetical protein